MSRAEGKAARSERATPSPAEGLGPEYRPDMKTVSLITVSTASGGLARRLLSSPPATSDWRAVVEYQPARLARRARYRKKDANFRISLWTMPCPTAHESRPTFRKESRQKRLAGVDGKVGGGEGPKGQERDGAEAHGEETEGSLHSGAIHEGADGRTCDHEGEPEHERGDRKHARAILGRRVVLHDGGEDRPLQPADGHEAEVEDDAPGRLHQRQSRVADEHEKTTQKQALSDAEGGRHPRARERHGGEPHVRDCPQRPEPRGVDTARLHVGLNEPDHHKGGEPEGDAERHGGAKPPMMPERESDDVPGSLRVRAAARHGQPRRFAQHGGGEPGQGGARHLEPERQTRRCRIEPASCGGAESLR